MKSERKSQDSVNEQYQNVPPHPSAFNAQENTSIPQVSSHELRHSVVPGLMKVYESMTQSSTPQFRGTSNVMQSSSTLEFHDTFPSNHFEPSDTSSHHQASLTSTSGPQVENHFVPPVGSYEGLEPPMVPPVPEYYSALSANQVSTNEVQPVISSKHMVADVPSDAASSSSGRSLRKRSIDKDSINGMDTGSQKARKKESTADGRWSKRFTWPDDLHRDFVSAIFDVGLKHSSPSAILEHMAKSEQVTSERIKSHLQKYRVHRAKSKKDFMTSYDSSLSKFKADNGADRSKPLSNGEMAAHLSLSTMLEADTRNDDVKEERVVEQSQGPPRPKDTSSKLILPQLSEEEKLSPIGTSLGYLLGLFFSLRQQLLEQRAASAAADANVRTDVHTIPQEYQIRDVFNHFDSGVPQGYSTDIPSEWQPPVHQETHAYLPDATPDAKMDAKAPPSTRTNFEQNKLMKREMENQMAFQSKMRDLKQRELNKYRSPDDHLHIKEEYHKTMEDDLTPNPVSNPTEEKDASSQEHSMARSQGAGETAEGSESSEKGRLRTMSVNVVDDFWNTDVVDEHLFEFLMNS